MLQAIYGFAIFCLPLFGIFKIFFDFRKSFILTIWVVASYFYIFVLGFGVGMGLTMLFEGDSWASSISLSGSPNLVDMWLADSENLWRLLVVPYIAVAQLIVWWFWIHFFHGSLILTVVTCTAFYFFLKLSIPFVKHITADSSCASSV